MAEDKDFSSVEFGSKKESNSGLSQREEMIAIIRAGGTTMHKGKHIRSVSQVPSEAELAAGDPQRSAEAAARLESQIADAKKQLEQIAESKPAKAKPEFKPIVKDEKVDDKAEAKAPAKK